MRSLDKNLSSGIFRVVHGKLKFLEWYISEYWLLVKLARKDNANYKSYTE